MNEAFIAAPRPGEDRARWLAAMRGYRERARTGIESQSLLLLFDGRRGAVRPAFSIAQSFNLRPGETLRVGAELRWESGDIELELRLEEADPADESSRGVLNARASMKVPRDGAWHRLEAEIEVPPGTSAAAVVRPLLSFDVVSRPQPGRMEMRRFDLVPGSAEQLDALRRVSPSPAAPSPAARGDAWTGYDRADLQWAANAFSCHFTFLYDRRLYEPDNGWQVDAFLRDGERTFGGYDAVVLWQAYPRIGVDARNQFDHYRDMPGGLPGLRRMVGEFHARGVKVFLDYNPWDHGTRSEGKGDEEALAELIAAIEADGIFLDTMLAAPPFLRAAVDEARPGVVIAPEGHPSVEQLAACNASWAQSLLDPNPPGALRLKWIEPRHMQHQIRRWATTRRADIETAFFNGSGILIWENVFGTWNPWSREDARLWSRCVHILRAFADSFSNGSWEPFVATRHAHLSAHRWQGDGYHLLTLRNVGGALRQAALLEIAGLPADAVIVDLWSAEPARIERRGSVMKIIGDVDSLGCFFIGSAGDPRLPRALQGRNKDGQVEPVTDRADARPVDLPRPVQRTARRRADSGRAGMAHVPGARARMEVSHMRRECGCHPDPGTPPDGQKDFLWGSPFEGTLEHHYAVDLSPFLVDVAQVSNADFKRFLDATGYRPRDPQSFLKHWDGGTMPESIAELPVVYVDLDDARTYARWASKRLPTEAEWQLAAQGLDGRAWPWGNTFEAGRCAPRGAGPMPVRSLPEGRSAYGCYHMSGNVWEWTESERDDGHTRFAIIRGGSWFKAEGSMWYVPGGPQPCTTHAKLLLMAPGLDRSATIGFRCVADVEN